MFTMMRKTYLLSVKEVIQLPRRTPICSLAKIKEMAEAAPTMMETEPVPFTVSKMTCFRPSQFRM